MSLLLAAGCCCKGSSAVCANCDSPTPIALTVVVSSATTCTNCVASGGDGYNFTSAPTVPSGSYTLTQSAVGGEECEYNYDEAASGTITHHANDDCSGAVVETWDIDRLFMKAVVFANGAIDLDIWWRNDSGIEESVVFYSYDDAGTGDCMSFNSLNNSRTDCTTSGGPVVARFMGAQDGSVTISPVWAS